MIFEQKKLNTETLNEYLAMVRESLGLSVEDVISKTGIKPAFLEKLEEGEFLKLPPDVYVKGFLKRLAALYNIEPDILICQYKKERDIQQQLYKPSNGEKTLKARLLGSLVITPKSVSMAVGILFVFVTLGYIIWQVSSINQVPALEIFQPKDRQVIKDSVVDVVGKTDPGMSVSVNGQNVFVDNQGNFKTQLGITAGQKDLAVAARNRFDKVVSKTISVIGEDEAVASSSPVQLKLEFSGDVSVQVTVDNIPEQDFAFHNGDVKQFSGQNRIVISTSDAGATKATLNGQDLGELGRPKESLKSISFFPENGNINNTGQ